MDTIVMTRGDTPTIDIHVVDKDGVDVDLSTVSLWFTAKRKITDTDAQAVIRKTTASGITLVSPSAGTAKIVFAVTDTINIEDPQALVLFWDLQTRTSAGVITTVDSGSMVIKAGITRAYVP